MLDSQFQKVQYIVVRKARGVGMLVHSKRSLELFSYTTAADKKQREHMQKPVAVFAFKAHSQ